MSRPERRGLYYRLYAALLARCTRPYERLMAERKRTLFADLRGDVVEIGAGAGPNLALYPPGVRVTAVEPNPYFDRSLRRAARKAGVPLTIVRGTAEALPLPDASVDAAVATLVLCSVDDPARAMAEIRRVLKPGGRFVWVEHVAAPPGTPLRWLQGAISPLWQRLADGCHPDRDTPALIETAGFAEVNHASFRLPAGGPAAPHSAGIAVK